MTRDARTHHSDDPAHRWAAQLGGLVGRTREAVIKSLRNSVDSGHPASPEGVRILVAYAQGRISARQYVAQILESLGFVPRAYTPAPVVREPEPWRAPVRRPEAWSDALLDFSNSRPPAPAPPAWRDSWTEPVREPERREGTTITQTRRISRQEVVHAYVNGQIPVEEFLRLSRARTS